MTPRAKPNVIIVVVVTVVVTVVDIGPLLLLLCCLSWRLSSRRATRVGDRYLPVNLLLIQLPASIPQLHPLCTPFVHVSGVNCATAAGGCAAGPPTTPGRDPLGSFPRRPLPAPPVLFEPGPPPD